MSVGMTTDMSDSVNLGAAGELDTICRASPPRQVATCHDMRMGHHGAPWGHLTRSDPCQIAPVQRRTCSSFIPKARPLGDSSAGKPRKACDGPCKTPRSRSTPVTVCHCNFTADNGKVNAEPFCSLHWDGILARRRSKSSKNNSFGIETTRFGGSESLQTHLPCTRKDGCAAVLSSNSSSRCLLTLYMFRYVQILLL